MTAIHIGLDGNEANVLNRVGSNRFAFNLIWALYRLNQNHRFTVYLKNTPAADLPPATRNWQYRVITPSVWWTQLRLPAELLFSQDRPDVFFSPGHYRPRFAPMPTAITILDLAFLHYPNLFLSYRRGTAQLKNWTGYSVKKASHIFAISAHTKNDLVATYSLDPSKITLTYPGIDTGHFKPARASVQSAVREKYALPQHFILYLGTLQPRKNLIRLVQAFSQLPPRFADFHLVIGGQKGWHYQSLLAEIGNSPQKAKIHLLGFIDQTDLPALYTQAACLCLVGLYEGFGIPPAEAIACGTVPLIAQTGALPEVVGAHAISADPFSVQSIKEGIIKILELTPRQKSLLINRYQSHIRQFSWTDSAQKVLDRLYELTLQR